MQVRISTEGGRTVIVPGQMPLPRTREELDALTLTRAELQSQIEALRASRSALSRTVDQMGDSPGRAALQQRVAEVDARILRLERQLDGVNDQIANAPTIVMGQVATTSPPTGALERAIARDIVPLTAIVTMFFLLPLAIAFARLLWKRGTAIGARPAVNEQLLVGRLDQLQTAMDTMAVEVERISEGQRYVTKLMAEKDKAALPR